MGFVCIQILRGVKGSSTFNFQFSNSLVLFKGSPQHMTNFLRNGRWRGLLCPPRPRTRRFSRPRSTPLMRRRGPTPSPPTHARARKLHCLNLPPILDSCTREQDLSLRHFCENRTAGERREPLPVLNGQRPPPGQGRRSKILAAGGGGGGCGGLRERMAGLSMSPPPPL